MRSLKNTLPFILPAMLLLNALTSPTSAETISLSTQQSQYRTELYQPTVFEWAENVSNLNHFLLNAYEKKINPTNENSLTHTLFMLPAYLVHLKLSYSIATVVHESGHAATDYLHGFAPYFGAGFDDEWIDLPLSVWDLYLNEITTSGRAYTGVDNPNNVTLTPIMNAQILGAGINYNTDFAKNILFQSLTSIKSKHNLIDFQVNRSLGALYVATNLNGSDPDGDPNRYISALNEQGYDITIDQLFYAHVAAFLLSPSSTDLSRFDADTSIYPHTLFDISFLLPEWFVYLNPSSVSMLTATLFPITQTKFFILEVESVLYGKRTPLELTFSVISKNTSGFSYKGSLNIDTDFNYFAKTEIKKKMNNILSLIANIKYGNNQTLKQTREWPYNDPILNIGVQIHYH